ncbi:hypothetical protein [Burkholderia sp. YIM B11467]
MSIGVGGMSVISIASVDSAGVSASMRCGTIGTGGASGKLRSIREFGVPAASRCGPAEADGADGARGTTGRNGRTLAANCGGTIGTGGAPGKFRSIREADASGASRCGSTTADGAERERVTAGRNGDTLEAYCGGTIGTGGADLKRLSIREADARVASDCCGISRCRFSIRLADEAPFACPGSRDAESAGVERVSERPGSPASCEGRPGVGRDADADGAGGAAGPSWVAA